jgi:dolichyl-phosphate beta-glucosyltransferase
MTVAIVVPCFDEAARFDVDAFVTLATAVEAVWFVDDGSRDGTTELLDRVASLAPGRAHVRRLGANRGKAEAVRAGMLAALADDVGIDVVGYLDADLATPVSEMLRLVEMITAEPALDVVLGSRVGLLGHAVERRMSRHYVGRLYATAASVALGVPVYDTQCGAKLFRDSPALRAALARSFPDRWSFDVELLARLLYPDPGVDAVGADAIVEVPLRAWRDVGGSKLDPLGSFRATLALAGVRRRIRRRTR